jgi:hypothetical protein
VKPLVLEPNTLSEPVLEELVRSLTEDLNGSLELVRHPPGPVRDPASIATAENLLTGTLAVLARPGPRKREEWTAEANLAYATLLATIDLVKSHTDVPRVPRGPAKVP